MSKKYLLQWLDLIVSQTFDPRKSEPGAITVEQTRSITEKVYVETYEIQARLKNQVFKLNKEKQIRLFISKYHSALVILLDDIMNNKNNIAFDKPHINQARDLIISSLDELLSFIENRFSAYLALDNYVPATYLSVSKKELRFKLDTIRDDLENVIEDKRVTEIVFGNLYSFFNSKRHRQVTFREVFYRKELVQELERLKDSSSVLGMHTAIHELLVYMNFNSNVYMNYYTEMVIEEMNDIKVPDIIAQRLKVLSAELNKLYSNKNASLYPNSEDLKTVLNVWFSNQISNILSGKQEIILSLRQSSAPGNQISQNKPKAKVLCMLPADQIALILRGADELQILKARSMSEVFKTIVPYLSTPNKAELSYDSMRSKSYAAEDKDKEVVIELLQRLIGKIKGY